MKWPCCACCGTRTKGATCRMDASAVLGHYEPCGACHQLVAVELDRTLWAWTCACGVGRRCLGDARRARRNWEAHRRAHVEARPIRCSVAGCKAWAARRDVRRKRCVVHVPREDDRAYGATA